MNKALSLLLAMLLPSLLGGCAPMLGLVSGISPPVLQLAAVIDRAKLISDGISYMSSGKTLSEHALSAATGWECRMIHFLKTGYPCTPRWVAMSMPAPTHPVFTPLALAPVPATSPVDEEHAPAATEMEAREETTETDTPPLSGLASELTAELR